jgi:hypothetical protein
MMSRNGFKLYDDETSFFSWHPSMEDARARRDYESDVYGRDLRIAQLTDDEAIFYRTRPVYE